MRLLLATSAFFLALIPVLVRTVTQETPPAKTQGQFLIASRDLPDPIFRDSVVLMLPIKDEGLLVGLIVNKPSKLLLHDVFPNSPALEKVGAKAYLGGPVDVDVAARSAIFRSKTPPKGATLVFGDVYVSFDSDAIAALAADSRQASTVRVFLGRSQWGTEQLENEVARGSWFNAPATADSIFTTFPESLWHTLIERADPGPVVRSAPRIAPPATILSSRAAFSANSF